MEESVTISTATYNVLKDCERALKDKKNILLWRNTMYSNTTCEIVVLDKKEIEEKLIQNSNDLRAELSKRESYYNERMNGLDALKAKYESLLIELNNEKQYKKKWWQ